MWLSWTVTDNKQKTNQLPLCASLILVSDSVAGQWEYLVSHVHLVVICLALDRETHRLQEERVCSGYSECAGLVNSREKQLFLLSPCEKLMGRI